MLLPQVGTQQYYASIDTAEAGRTASLLRSPKAWRLTIFVLALVAALLVLPDTEADRPSASLRAITLDGPMISAKRPTTKAQNPARVWGRSSSPGHREVSAAAQRKTQRYQGFPVESEFMNTIDTEPKTDPITDVDAGDIPNETSNTAPEYPAAVFMIMGTALGGLVWGASKWGSSRSLIRPANALDPKANDDIEANVEVDNPPNVEVEAGLVLYDRSSDPTIDNEGDEYGDELPEDCPDNYYMLMSVDEEVEPIDLKKQYRKIQMVCHPDKVGEEGVELCMLVNQAYDTLSDPVKKQVYDAELQEQKIAKQLLGLDKGIVPYNGRPLSKIEGTDPTGENRAVFVDESSCIGCQACTHVATKTFFIEDDYGRARVKSQWADGEEDIETAIQSCPVDCIHWVKKDQLAELEYVMQAAKRVGVAVMMTGGAGADPFEMAVSFAKRRDELRRNLGLAEDHPMNFIQGNTARMIRQIWGGMSPELKAKWRETGALDGIVD